MVIYAEDRSGQVKTHFLPESSIFGNWGKTAAHRSGVPRENKSKVAKNATGPATEVATSSKKRDTPNDDRHIADTTHSEKCPKPRKLIRTISPEPDVIPETLPKGSTPTITPSSSIWNEEIANYDMEYKEPGLVQNQTYRGDPFWKVPKAKETYTRAPYYS